MENYHNNPVDGNIQTLDRSLGFMVNGLARLMRMALENRLRSAGLTPTIWTVLMALGEEDNFSQTDLARRTLLDGATITRALDALESKGYIERHRDDDDRRVQIVALTDTGRTAYYDMARCGEQVNNEAVAELSNDEQRQLFGMFQMVLKRMNNLHSNDEGSYAF